MIEGATDTPTQKQHHKSRASVLRERRVTPHSCSSPQAATLPILLNSCILKARASHELFLYCKSRWAVKVNAGQSAGSSEPDSSSQDSVLKTAATLVIT